uniref:Band 7 domain-containing protein n=1 Tax=Chromera velia CCMP2878 TaxID=1169474 RepID=A0A0G4G007_9ALVE|mmetsp:Transcript_28579/g.55973  ORF Transcript_28579/g.55973 Transcript_28579/m.55973 type:complete len:413 (+) Transcript_28579:192-1430(+)|eukprot:Cvel_3986.t1-p1 / transcript=Cvel_3986.t1 / gene=Cvel_3986 / organism=Chromera_velia_CCMP2878 / gene_product=hypothetical protein / transcript_product=hypothetical protein / location=Cvel_scaffold169:53169-56441(-) / protein_length=412 / sequence_SO=supercontig / SO=protein_coding / is_pseudo=false
MLRHVYPALSFAAFAVAGGIFKHLDLPFPLNVAIPLAVGLLVPLFCVLDYLRRWEIANPDEWQLLIRNGKLVQSGVGACHFKDAFDTVVRFPSSIQKVTFKVEQVTSEMQGVVVSGYALWSVHREGEGPWKAYKNLMLRDKDRDGTSDSKLGSGYISDLATSIIRVCIAQQTLQSCLTRRDEIRDSVREQMMATLPGWGVWLETVEITDVRISSKALFEDLQAEFRAEQRLKAERVRLGTERKLQEEQLAADLEAAKRKAEAETQKAVTQAEQKYVRQEKESKSLELTQKILLERLEREKAYALAELQKEKEVEMRRQENAQALNKMKVDAELEILKKKDERVQHLTEGNFRLMQIEATKEVFSRISDFRVSAFNGGAAGGADPSTLLPAAGALGFAQQVEVLEGVREGRGR